MDPVLAFALRLVEQHLEQKKNVCSCISHIADNGTSIKLRITAVRRSSWRSARGARACGQPGRRPCRALQGRALLRAAPGLLARSHSRCVVCGRAPVQARCKTGG